MDNTGKNIPDRIRIGMDKKFAERFSVINRLITRDLNNYRSTPKFSRYTKDDITKFLSNPYAYEKQLRAAILYIYTASPHFRRLIQYFTSLSDLAYIVSPYRIDPRKANVRTTGINYRRVLDVLSAMNIKTQFPKILTVCLREDVFYGTLVVSRDSIIVQQLPSDYCRIACIENNVLNVAFDFTYFDAHPELLPYYSDEFKMKYELYKENMATMRWIELSAPESFAVKFNNDILEYAIPPFAGLLREIYDIEDYKQMRLTKQAIENYAMLYMKLPMNDEGEWLLDETKAEKFWRNLDEVLPEEVGSALTPMDIEKISFERSNTAETNNVANAEQELFTAAGVESLLFNNTKASSNALLLSIKVDQALTFGIVKSIEDVLNRYIQYQNYGKNFKVTFLNVSCYNMKEAGDAYLKAASYGLPTICAYSASQGIGQAELDSMSFLETDVLKLQELFKPIVSSTQLSKEDADSSGEINDPNKNEEGGAPEKDIGEVSDSRETNRELE